MALFSRLLFGSSGACLATLIFFSTAIYYAVFEGSVIAVALNHLYPQLVYPLAALLVVLYSVPLILGSVQHWLDKLNGVLLPVYLALRTAWASAAPCCGPPTPAPPPPVAPECARR